MQLFARGLAFVLGIAALGVWAAGTVYAEAPAAPTSPQSLYASGKYEEALQALRSHPAESAQYFYNIGTIHLRLDQPGQARAYLEKANALRSHDPEIQNNLQLARSALGRLIGNDRLDPASTGLESMADRVSMDEVRAVLGFLGLIVALFWLRAYLKTRSLKRTLLQPAGLVGLIGVAVTAGLYAVERAASASPAAFLLERQAIRSGPGEQFVQLGLSESGMKIRLLGPRSEGWSQVRYSQDGIGWVKTSSLLLL